MGKFIGVQDITQKTFSKLLKFSHPADLEIYYFNLKLAIELYWWHIKCLLRNMSLKKHHKALIIMEFSKIFNVNLCWFILETAGYFVFKLDVPTYY
mgnify:CR=1 FL=1